MLSRRTIHVNIQENKGHFCQEWEKSPYLCLKGAMHLTFSLILSSQANRLYIRISYNQTIWPLEIEISISIGIYKVICQPKICS